MRVHTTSGPPWGHNDAQDLQTLKLDRIIGCSQQGCSDGQTGICGAPEKCPSGGDIALRQMPLAYGQQPFLSGLREVRERWRWRTVASGPVNHGFVFRAQGCGRLLVRREHDSWADYECRCGFGENGPFNIDKGDAQV